MTASRPPMSDRCREIVRICKTYGGMGVPKESIREVLAAFQDEPGFLPIEVELALHQYVPAHVFDSDTPSRSFARVVIHNERGSDAGQRLSL